MFGSYRTALTDDLEIARRVPSGGNGFWNTWEAAAVEALLKEEEVKGWQWWQASNHYVVRN
jgi:hypothetical protein